MPEKKTKKTKSQKDPYMSRNEFKPGFYDQPDKPAMTDRDVYGDLGKPETGVTSNPMGDISSSADSEIMKQSFMEGGTVKGQYAVQVKKVPFKGIF